MRFVFYCMLLCLLLVFTGCEASKSTTSAPMAHQTTSGKIYTIDFPAGWKVEELDSALFPGASGEMASNENGAIILVAKSDKAYDFSKHYDLITNDLAVVFADQLFTPLVQTICPTAGLGGPPSITPLNDGRSIQAMYVCEDEVLWLNTVFGKKNAFMILATGDKSDRDAANAAMKCRNSFKLLE